MTTDAASEWGILESGQRLVNPAGRDWNEGQLLQAAERGVLRNTGWPIGVVLRNDERPVVTEDGIEARIDASSFGGRPRRARLPTWEDYWRFKRDGNYYVARIMEEDINEEPYTSSEGHPDKALWFDLRIWRIAEVILHSASLYRALDIPPDEPYLLAISHSGLNGREFYTSTPRRHVLRGRVSNVEQVSWSKEVTQDLVQADYRDLVAEVANRLFVVFDFAGMPPQVVNSVIDEFDRRR